MRLFFFGIFPGHFEQPSRIFSGIFRMHPVFFLKKFPVGNSSHSNPPACQSHWRWLWVGRLLPREQLLYPPSPSLQAFLFLASHRPSSSCSTFTNPPTNAAENRTQPSAGHRGQIPVPRCPSHEPRAEPRFGNAAGHEKCVDNRQHFC